MRSLHYSGETAIDRGDNEGSWWPGAVMAIDGVVLGSRDLELRLRQG